MIRMHQQQEEMWTLSGDRRTVCLSLPSVTVTKPGPVTIRVNLDAQAIDAILTRLTRLRVQMLPPPQKN